MRFLGTRANQNFFMAKLGLVTHENEPKAILEVLGQKPKLIFLSQNF